MTSTRTARLRGVLPWCVGAAILVVVGTHVPFAQFRASIVHGPNIALAAVELMITCVVFSTDSLATWFGLSAQRISWSLRKTAVVRGATYLLFLLNYAVAQGGFGYYLYRDGEPAPRAAGITLFLLGTNLATLLVLTFSVWVVMAASDTNPSVWWTLVFGTAAFVCYLVVIRSRISVLAKRPVLAPLFEAGLGGHASAMLGRVPHVIAIVMGHWVAMRVWGIPVSLADAAVKMPAVALASVLPISPAGLGTTQAALVYFFQNDAAGVTAEDRSAAVLAFGVVHFVYGVGAALVVGVIGWRTTRKSKLLPAAPVDPAASR